MKINKKKIKKYFLFKNHKKVNQNELFMNFYTFNVFFATITQ